MFSFIVLVFVTSLPHPHLRQRVGLAASGGVGGQGSGVLIYKGGLLHLIINLDQ